MTGFVLDASTAVAWALDEPDRWAAQAWARIRGDHALVPTLWWFELRNALVVNERRGRIAEQQTARFLRDVSQLAIIVDNAPDESNVMNLARRHRLTVYHAAYLELAVRAALPLATLDAALTAAAHADRVPLLDDAGGEPEPAASASLTARSIAASKTSQSCSPLTG